MNDAHASEPAVMSAGDYWGVLKRRKWRFLLPLLLATLTAAAFALLLPAKYQSEAAILIERSEVPESIVGTTVTGFVQERIENITQRVLTRENLMNTAEAAGISTADLSHDQKNALQRQLKDAINVEMVDIKAADPSKGRATILTVAFTISAISDTAASAQAMVRYLSDLYLEENLRSRVEQAAEVSGFLDKQANDLKARIAETEARLARFKVEQQGQLPGQMEMNQTLLERTDARIETAEEHIRSLQNQQRGLQAQLRTMDRYVSRDADLDRANSPVERLAIARKQLNEVRQRYSDLHPEVKRLKSQVASLEAEVRAQGGSTSASATNPEYIAVRSELNAIGVDLAAEKQKLAELELKSSELSERLLKAPVVEKEYSSLVREFDADRLALDELTRKQKQAEIAYTLEEEGKGQRFTLSQPASLPSLPVSPNRIAILALGVFLGSVLGLAAVLLAEMGDKTIRGVRKLEQVLGAPPIGIIPDRAMV